MSTRYFVSAVAVLAGSIIGAQSLLAQTPCININDCTGGGYSVMSDYSMSNPDLAPTNAAGPTSGGFCSTNEVYRTYVAWCNQSGCTAVSPASSDFQPSAGTTNYIAVTRPPIPSHATSWSAYVSKASQGHLTIRNCAMGSATVGTIASAVVTSNCQCSALGGSQQSTNSTGVIQTNRLHPSGTVSFSGADGTVQGKLTPEKHILDYAKDTIPRFSPNAGATYRSVDWNSAKVVYVDSTLGAATGGPVGTSVLSTINGAMTLITDSSYTNPYVVKLRSNDGTVLPGGTINKPYVWIQGDGATRVGQIYVKADGVRVSGLITPAIYVGDLLSYAADDLDNIWITNNVMTNDADGEYCGVIVNVGGGTRTHGVMVSNNRLGGSSAPGAAQGNKCQLLSFTDNGGLGTVVQFVGNYVENSYCIHGSEPIAFRNLTQGDATKITTISSGNTLFCNIIAGVQEAGENVSCFDVEGSMGSLYSEGDTCMIYRPDAGPYLHTYAIFQTDQTYAGPYPRTVELVNTTFLVNLPASHFSGDSIGVAYLDAPYLSLMVSNPRYHEIALGSGWTSGNKYFVDVDGWRTSPPNSSNTFLYWDNMSLIPSSTILYTNGASATSITAKPAGRMLTDSFDAGLMLTGATLGSTCSVDEFRYDTGGATKELCICDPANTWNCVALGAKQD